MNILWNSTIIQTVIRNYYRQCGERIEVAITNNAEQKIIAVIVLNGGPPRIIFRARYGGEGESAKRALSRVFDEWCKVLDIVPLNYVMKERR